MTRRVLSLWFPRLASDLARRRLPGCGGVGGPLVLSLRIGNADYLHCLDAAAEAAGLARGMALGDARVLCPQLRSHPADPAATARGLAALRRAAGRYSPLVAEDGADGLVLDIAGVAHLFGGEAALLDDLHRRFARAGIALQSGLADSRGAAWALARHGPGRAVAAPGQGLAALGPLPVAALRLETETVAGLGRLGLRRVGDLAARPRAPLARRFGPGLLMRLDQALGAQPEPVAPAPPEPHFGVRLALPEPVGRHADVMAGLDRLLGPLCGRLAAQAMGARRLRLELRRVDGAGAVVEVGLARPQRDPAAIAALFARGVEAVDAGFGIDGLRLSVPLAEPLVARQMVAEAAAGLAAPGRLAGAAARGRDGAGGAEESRAFRQAPGINAPGIGAPGANAPGDPGPAALRGHAARRDTPAGRGSDRMADLLSRLGNRLGFDNLHRFAPAESHVPERSFLTLSALWAEAGAGPVGGPGWAAAPERPVILFPPEPLATPGPVPPLVPPVRFRWRRQTFDRLRATGPERIAPEWWLDDPGWRSGPRDYWKVETRQGRRLWLFHTPLAPGWHVQGEFA